MADRTSIEELKYKILPYVQYDGAWSIPDSFIKECWDKLVENGLHEALFYSGVVIDREGFVQYLKLPMNKVFFIFIKKEIAAITWLNGVKQNYALVHGTGFPVAWGKHTKPMMKEMLKAWFGIKKEDGEFLFDLLVGETPVNNPFALKFIETIGMKRVGVVPLIAHDVYKKEKIGMAISYIKREV